MFGHLYKRICGGILRLVERISGSLYRRAVRIRLHEICQYRESAVRDFVYTYVPSLFGMGEIWRKEGSGGNESEVMEGGGGEGGFGLDGLLVIEGGRFNYFPLSDGKGPRFDFVLPQIALFVFICGPEHTPKWEDAKEYGLKYEDWLRARQDLDILKTNFPRLTVEGPPSRRARLWIIEWDDSVAVYSLERSLCGLIDAEMERGQTR